MANEIRLKFDAKASFTISLGSLAAAAARQSTMVANSSARPGAIVYVKIESGTAPTGGTTYEVYLLRGDDASSSTYRTDGAGASDAAFTPNMAILLGAIVVSNSGNTYFYGEFDTSVAGPLGPEWGVAVKNNTNQSLNSTGGNHLVEYAYYVPELQ
jgi:hypothetical protein